MRAHLNTLLSIILLVATAAGFAISFVMLQRVIGSSSPWLGLLAMIYFLGLAKMAEPLFLLRMPGVLRVIRPREIKGATYRRLLVPSFGTFLRETPLRYLNGAVYLTQATPNLLKIYRQAEAAEAAHFWAALLFTPYIAYVGLSGRLRNLSTTVRQRQPINYATTTSVDRPPVQRKEKKKQEAHQGRESKARDVGCCAAGVRPARPRVD